MVHAIIPDSLSRGTWCTECGKPTSKRPSVDPFSICLACPAGHRQSILPSPSVTDKTDQARALKLPDLEGMNSTDTALFWLTNEHVRPYLNEQIGILLRNIVEIMRDGYNLNRPHPFKYCPACGSPLEEFEQPDIWVQGLRCSQGHEYAERGSHLGASGMNLYIHNEFEERTVNQLAHAWLKRGGDEERWLLPQLHKSIEKVFEEYLRHVATRNR